MEDFTKPRALGQTGMMVNGLGVSGGYGAPAEAFEMAFERGCNYFYHGSQRKDGMNQAIRNLCQKGKREELVILGQIYTRFGWHFRRSFDAFLKKSALDYVDVLLLGWYNSEPSKRILDAAAELKEKGLAKSIAISGHHRPSFPEYAKTGRYDIFHMRYNAAHRGAETEIFPKLPEQGRPGIVIYTATSWGKLLKSGKMPPGETTPRASDCYRFVLSNPNVDVCITGPKNMEQMKEALATLDRGPMTEDELNWMRKVGDHVHG
jgi:aryl-alcohol dehydrogenase-like predicted oxidoreductase